MNNQKEGLAALERLMVNYYEMCQDLGNNDDQYQRCNLTSERAIIEKELKEHEQYKAIEEELGIDLIKFSKILFALDNETVYVKEMIYKQYDGYGCFEETGKVERCCIVRFSRAINGNKDWFFIIHFGYIPNEYLYRLQDYGKTWALTREELEK